MENIYFKDGLKDVADFLKEKGYIVFHYIPSRENKSVGQIDFYNEKNNQFYCIWVNEFGLYNLGSMYKPSRGFGSGSGIRSDFGFLELMEYLKGELPENHYIRDYRKSEKPTFYKNLDDFFKSEKILKYKFY